MASGGSSIVIDWTISIGSLITGGLTFVGMVAGAVGIYYAMRNKIEVTGAQLTASAGRTDDKINTLGGRMINLEIEIKELKDVVITQAVQDEKIEKLREDFEGRTKYNDEFRGWVRDRFDEMQKLIYERSTPDG